MDTLKKLKDLLMGIHRGHVQSWEEGTTIHRENYDRLATSVRHYRQYKGPLDIVISDDEIFDLHDKNDIIQQFKNASRQIQNLKTYGSENLKTPVTLTDMLYAPTLRCLPNMSKVFYQNVRLCVISDLDLTGVVDLSNFANGCYMLYTAPNFSCEDRDLKRNLAGIFKNCYSLREADLSMMENITSLSFAFGVTMASTGEHPLIPESFLEKVILPVKSPNLTAINSIFNNCKKLTTVENLESMLQSCANTLQHIGGAFENTDIKEMRTLRLPENMPNLTSVGNAFRESHFEEIWMPKVHKYTIITNLFYRNPNLRRVHNFSGQTFTTTTNLCGAAGSYGLFQMSPLFEGEDGYFEISAPNLTVSAGLSDMFAGNTMLKEVKLDFPQYVAWGVVTGTANYHNAATDTAILRNTYALEKAEVSCRMKSMGNFCYGCKSLHTLSGMDMSNLVLDMKELSPNYSQSALDKCMGYVTTSSFSGCTSLRNLATTGTLYKSGFYFNSCPLSKESIKRLLGQLYDWANDPQSKHTVEKFWQITFKRKTNDYTDIDVLEEPCPDMQDGLQTIGDYEIYDYATFNGNDWVLTDLVPQVGDDYELHFTRFTTSLQFPISQRGGEANAGISPFGDTNTTSLQHIYFGSRTKITISNTYDIILKSDVKNKVVTCNGVDYTIAVGSTSTTVPVMIGADNFNYYKNGTVMYNFVGNVYYYKIEGKFDLRPAKNIKTGEVGFYDLIGGIFYRSQKQAMVLKHNTWRSFGQKKGWLIAIG